MPDDWKRVRREAIGVGLVRCHAVALRLRELRATELLAFLCQLRLERSERRFRPRADGFPLVLGDGCENMDGELVGVGQIDVGAD